MKYATILLAAVGILLLATGATAQTAPPAEPSPAPAAQPAKPPVLLGEGKGSVTLTWDEFVKITGYDPSKKGGQVLTVPWTEVESLLGVELKGKVAMDRTSVDLPWNDFKALMEWSLRKKAELETPPPTDFIVTSSQYEAVLDNDTAAFTLKLKLNVLRKNGWKRIPVLPAGVALTDMTVPEGVFVNTTGAGGAYELLTEKAGAIDVTLKFSVAVNKSSGIYSVNFERTLPGSSVLDLTIDGEQVDAKVAASQSLVTKVADKKTHVAAAIATGAAVGITWERAVPKAPAAPTKLYAETRTLASVAEGVLICQEAVYLNILHSPVQSIKLTVPAKVSVLEVTGRSVQDWRVDKGELTVALRGDAIGAYELRVSYEAPTSGQTAEVPVLRVVGVEREKGFVGVVALVNVEIDAGAVDGATVVDVRQLPTDIVAMTKQPILLAFRYVGEKFSIPLTIKKHGEVGVLVTIVDSALFTTMQLDDGRRMTRAIYTVRNNRNQFLRLEMPMKADIWSASVGGNTVNPAKDEKQSVLIPLIRSEAGAAELASFPVELVYVETPEKVAPAAGRMHVALPKLVETPAMHVMVNYYAPAEGKYGKAGGFFAPATSGFTGTPRLAENFASMTTDKGVEVVAANMQKQTQAMQQQFEAKTEEQAKAAGATPIRVRLPINGKLFKLEKILALPGDELFFDVDYADWKPAQ